MQRANLVIFCLVFLYPCFSIAQDRTWYSSEGIYKGDVYSILEMDDGSIFAGTIKGIYYTDNLLDRWKAIGLMDEWIFSLAKNSKGVIFAGAYGGLYKSYDKGLTWDEILIGKTHWVKDILIDNTDKIFVSFNDGNFYSTDDGNNWIEVTTLSLGVNALDNFNDKIYFAAPWGEGVFLSTDAGLTWNKTNFNRTIFTFAVAPTGRIWAAGSSGFIFISNDTGKTWTKLETEISPGNIKCMTVNKDNELYIGGYNSIYKTTDDGISWTSILDVYGGFNSLIVNKQGNILAGTNGSGIYYSDFELVWKQSKNGIKNYNISSIIIDDKQLLYAVNQLGSYTYDGILEYNNNFDKIYESSDYGKNWELVASTNYIINDIIFHPSGKIIGATENDGIICSEDKGKSWFIIGGQKFTPVGKLAINSKDHIIAAIDGLNQGGIYFSSDNGKNWVLKNNGILHYGCRDIIVDDNDNIFISTVGSVYFSSDNGDNWKKCLETNAYRAYLTITSNNNIVAVNEYADVFFSNDNGQVWEEFKSDTFTALVNSVSINENDEIVIGTNYGIYSSDFDEISWKKLNANLPDCEVKYIKVLSADKILASVEYQGLYYSDLTSNIDIINNDIDFYLSQNYPNPFNPTTTINYQIPNAGFVSLKVYDILGREVTTLINEEKSMGNYEVVFDGSDLSNGIYFYRIHAGNYSEIRKMILLK